MIKASDTDSVINYFIDGLIAEGLENLENIYVEAQGGRARANQVRGLFARLRERMPGKQISVSTDPITQIIPQHENKIAVVALHEIGALSSSLQALGTDDSQPMDPLLKGVYARTLIRAGRLLVAKLNASSTMELKQAVGEVARELNMEGAFNVDKGFVVMVPSVIANLITAIRSTQAAAKAA